MTLRTLLTKARKASERAVYFARTGYLHTGERDNPDFANQNFREHLEAYQFAKQFAVGADVLDCGCGTGYGTALLGEVAKSAFGIDISQQAVRFAKRRYSQVRFEVMNVECLRFPDRTFDFIYSSENFEHLRDHRAHLREVRRVLRSQGVFFVATPNPEMFWGIHNRYHTHEFSFGELKSILQDFFTEVVIIESQGTPKFPGAAALHSQREHGLESLLGLRCPSLANSLRPPT